MISNTNKKLITLLLIVLLIFEWVTLFLLWQAQQGDLNHDGKVNVQDLSTMARHYGKKD